MGERDLGGRTQPGVGDHGGGDGLVEGDPAGRPDAADEGDAEQGEHLAQRAVLAGLAVQHGEHHRAGGLGQARDQGGVDVGLEHVEAPRPQRLGHPAPRAQRDLALVGEAAGQDDDQVRQREVDRFDRDREVGPGLGGGGASGVGAHAWFVPGAMWLDSSGVRPALTGVPKVDMSSVS